MFGFPLSLICAGDSGICGVVAGREIYLVGWMGLLFNLAVLLYSIFEGHFIFISHLR